MGFRSGSAAEAGETGEEEERGHRHRVGFDQVSQPQQAQAALEREQDQGAHGDVQQDR